MGVYLHPASILPFLGVHSAGKERVKVWSTLSSSPVAKLCVSFFRSCISANEEHGGLHRVLAWCFPSLPDTFSTLRHMINSLNQMAFIFFPAEHDVKVGSLYTP